MVVSFVISLFRTDGFIIAYTGLSTRTLWSSVHDVTLFSSFRCNPHFTLRLSCSFQSLLTLNLLHLASVNVVENFFSRRPAYNEERWMVRGLMELAKLTHPSAWVDHFGCSPVILYSRRIGIHYFIVVLFNSLHFPIV